MDFFLSRSYSGIENGPDTLSLQDCIACKFFKLYCVVDIQSQLLVVYIVGRELSYQLNKLPPGFTRVVLQRQVRAYKYSWLEYLLHECLLEPVKPKLLYC